MGGERHESDMGLAMPHGGVDTCTTPCQCQRGGGARVVSLHESCICTGETVAKVFGEVDLVHEASGARRACLREGAYTPRTETAATSEGAKGLLLLVPGTKQPCNRTSRVRWVATGISSPGSAHECIKCLVG